MPIRKIIYKIGKKKKLYVHTYVHICKYAESHILPKIYLTKKWYYFKNKKSTSLFHVFVFLKNYYLSSTNFLPWIFQQNYTSHFISQVIGEREELIFIKIFFRSFVTLNAGDC